MTVSFYPRTLANGTLLLLGALFFLWPVVAGIPGVHLRLVWIAVTAGLCLLSDEMLRRSLRNAPELKLAVPTALPPALIAGCLALLAYGTTIPLLAFGDEITIALPALGIGWKLAHVIGWVGLFFSAAACIAAGALIATYCSRAWTVVLFLLMACAAAGIAYVLPETSSLVRYPPLVNGLQLLSTIITGGSTTLLRMPNVLWTLLLAISVWQMPWKTSAKIALIAGMTLGPLGWTYRIALFQACGEITLGLIAALLLAGLLEQKDRRGIAGLLGVIHALWFLERPTAIAALLGSIVLLWIFGRRKDSWTVAAVALPVVGAWLLLSPLYTASYGFGAAGAAAGGSVLSRILSPDPFIVAAQSLPLNLHPLALAVLLLTTVLCFLRGSRPQRLLLLSAWVMAVTTAALQHPLAGDVFRGVARYNILLILPLGLGIGMLMQGIRLPKGLSQLLSALALFALLVITPFDFVAYTQMLRATFKDIYHTPTEGYLAMPIEHITKEFITEPHLIIIAPQYTFLDLFVATGKLSPAQRSDLIHRSQAWTPASPDRPVLVQAPITTSYRPNLSAEAEERLRAAHEWALKQKDHRIIKLGIEETVVVP